MKSFNQLARIAYAAYCKRAGGKTYDGKPLPGWTDIGVERQACWIEAVKAVVHEVQSIH
jgi:hypothetical protein